MAISVYSLNVMKYMENRITQWIKSALYDTGTNLIRHIFVIKRYDKLKLISYWIKRVEKLKF